MAETMLNVDNCSDMLHMIISRQSLNKLLVVKDPIKISAHGVCLNQAVY